MQLIFPSLLVSTYGTLRRVLEYRVRKLYSRKRESQFMQSKTVWLPVEGIYRCDETVAVVGRIDTQLAELEDATRAWG